MSDILRVDEVAYKRANTGCLLDPESARSLCDSHEALRAALEASERTVDDQAAAIDLLHAQAADYARRAEAAEERAVRAEQTAEAQMTIVYAAEARGAALTEAAREFEALSAPADGHPEGQATWRVAQHRLLEVAGLLRATPPEGEA